MSGTFPTLPGLAISVKRYEVYSTVVQVGSSGKEQRGSFQATPRFTYELTFNCFRQTGFSPNTVSDELAALQAFFESQLGQMLTFNYTDPVSSSVVTCRFAQDTMDIERIVALCWKGASAVKLITVK